MSHCILCFLSGDDVKKSLQMAEAIEAMAKAFQELSKNNIVVPPKIHLDIHDKTDIALIMPVYRASQKQLIIKAISLSDYYIYLSVAGKYL